MLGAYPVEIHCIPDITQQSSLTPCTFLWEGRRSCEVMAARRCSWPPRNQIRALPARAIWIAGGRLLLCVMCTRRRHTHSLSLTHTHTCPPAREQTSTPQRLRMCCSSSLLTLVCVCLCLCACACVCVCLSMYLSTSAAPPRSSLATSPTCSRLTCPLSSAAPPHPSTPPPDPPSLCVSPAIHPASLPSASCPCHSPWSAAPATAMLSARCATLLRVSVSGLSSAPPARSRGTSLGPA